MNANTQKYLSYAALVVVGLLIGGFGMYIMHAGDYNKGVISRNADFTAMTTQMSTLNTTHASEMNALNTTHQNALNAMQTQMDTLNTTHQNALNAMQTQMNTLNTTHESEMNNLTPGSSSSKTVVEEFPEFGQATADIIGLGTTFVYASTEGIKKGGDLYFKIATEDELNDAVESAKLRDNADNRASQLLSNLEAGGYLMFRNGDTYQAPYWTNDVPTEIAYSTPFDGTSLQANYEYD